jgi:aromatic ring hydroxylase
LQRAALLQLAWDHVSSALDGRESAFELHASGGMPNWRGWLRQNFRDYNALANAVLHSIDIEMPEIDLSAIPNAAITRRRFAAGVPPAGRS